MLTALLLLLLAAPGSRLVPGADQEILDRTLALVGGQPITLSDVRAVTALGLIDAAAGTPLPVDEVVSRLVDRELILREVRRYDTPPPAEAAVDARLEAIRKRFPDAAAMTRALDRLAFTELRLRTWVRDELRAQSYLAQRFASASSPTDEEIRNAYLQSKAEFDKAGQTFDAAVPVIRDRLVGQRRQELIADWVQDLRRRTDVVLIQR